uniref:Uncharacterized protein n=1 Tax=Arundo donax TaxID=35708 RepID=A0A0A9BER5_ARUDO
MSAADISLSVEKIFLLRPHNFARYLASINVNNNLQSTIKVMDSLEKWFWDIYGLHCYFLQNGTQRDLNLSKCSLQAVTRYLLSSVT